jgi:hydroxyacyl-ACP dehydratase HTD2-like protein with hotdog domain
MTARVSTAQPRYADVKAGTELEPRSFQVSRADLIRYAGASGDFNVIHWNERIATSVGLPNVIAHGMFTMAKASTYVTEWAGDPGAVVEFGVRFSAVVVVPDTDPLGGSTGGATIEVSGTIEEKLDDSKVVIALTAVSSGAKVLTRARAVVRLP